MWEPDGSLREAEPAGCQLPVTCCSSDRGVDWALEGWTNVVGASLSEIIPVSTISWAYPDRPKERPKSSAGGHPRRRLTSGMRTRTMETTLMTHT